MNVSDTRHVSANSAPAHALAHSPLVQYVIPFFRMEGKWFCSVAERSRDIKRAPSLATILGAVMSRTVRQCECLGSHLFHEYLVMDVTHISVIERMWYHRSDYTAQDVVCLSPGLALVLGHVNASSNDVMVDNALQTNARLFQN